MTLVFITLSESSLREPSHRRMRYPAKAVIVVAVVVSAVIIALPSTASTAVGHANRLILNENWIDH